MRIIVDLQGAQTSFSKYRGVGRYSRELTYNLYKLAVKEKDIEIVLILNGAFPNSIDEIKGYFESMLNPPQVYVWQQFYDTTACIAENKAKRWIAALIREAFVASLDPHILFIPNMQEGLFDPAVTSFGLVPHSGTTFITLHDVTPLRWPRIYLKDKIVRKWYLEKIEQTLKADFIITDSEYSRQQIASLTTFPLGRIFVVPPAVDHKRFRPLLDQELTLAKAELRKKFGISSPFVLYVGGTDYHKNLETLYQAFAQLPPNVRKGTQLVLCGKDFVIQRKTIIKKLERYGIASQVVLTGHVDDETLVALYNLCDLFVFPSFDEGFGMPALEAMACGAPVLVGDAASLKEIVPWAESRFDPFDCSDLRQKMEALLADESLREKFKKLGVRRSQDYSWELSAQKLLEIFLSHRKGRRETRAVAWAGTFSADAMIDIIVEKTPTEYLKALKQNDVDAIALSIAETWPVKPQISKKRLLLHVTSVLHEEQATGIENVALNLMRVLSQKYQDKLEVVPFAMNLTDAKLRNAASIVGEKFNINFENLKLPEFVELYADDVVLFVDLYPAIVTQYANLFRYWRNKGVKIFHLIHDILPIEHPEWFFKDTSRDFEQWLKIVCEVFDGAVCVSKTTADKVFAWVENLNPKRCRPFKIGWFHNGTNCKRQGCRISDTRYQSEIKSLIEGDELLFLMVGTLEPRKGHLQVLRAFEMLWENGFRMKLIIVGKRGWLMDKFIQELVTHKELGRRLFWLGYVDTELLHTLYSSCSALIMASFDEGFGLPLIEAACHEAYIIARDIPIFREVCGDHAFYFRGDKPEDLADAICTWLKLFREGRAPSTKGMKWLTWEESTQQLLDVILGGKWYKIWEPK